jgi:predicted HTH domain antitoxin
MPTMIQPHPHYVVDGKGQRTAVQLTIDGYRELVLAAFASGRLSAGQAADLLDITRPQFYALARTAGISTCNYTLESIQAELAQF